MFRRKEEVVVLTVAEQIAQAKSQLEELEGAQSLVDQVVDLTDTVERLKKDKANADRKLDYSKELADNLNLEILALKNEHKMATEDLAHMIKMKSERAALEQDKFKAAQEKKFATDLAEATKSHQNALTDILKSQIEKGDALVERIIARLPDASIAIKHKTKD